MYGQITAPLVGYAMKEMCRRAMTAISAQRAIFEAQVKESYAGDMDDLVTSADLEAQEIYLKMIRESFPGYGILAEEDNLRIDCDLPGQDLYFTIDPLDGTKAFGRRQSTGIATMLSLVDGQKSAVLAAYIGDVMTGELYGYRPESDKVHRITKFDRGEELKLKTHKSGKSKLLLRAAPWDYGECDVKMLAEEFKDIEIEGGSVGLSFARLWKGEVGAILLPPGKHETPWDSSPIIGITKKLGYRFREIIGWCTTEENDTRDYDFKPPRTIFKREMAVLITA